MFLKLAFADEPCKRIDIRAQPEREVLRQLVGKGRLDIQQRQGIEGRGGLEGAIVGPAGQRAKGTVTPIPAVKSPKAVRPMSFRFAVINR